MATLRSLYIITSDKKLLFSREFPTVENRQKRNLPSELYVKLPNEDIIKYLFYNQVIREELLQESFTTESYNEKMEVDNQKLDELIDLVNFDINLENFNYFTECPIINIDLQQYSKDNFCSSNNNNNNNNIYSSNQCNCTYQNDPTEDCFKCSLNTNNFENYFDYVNSELKFNVIKGLWPTVYTKKNSIYCLAILAIDANKITYIKDNLMYSFNSDNLKTNSIESFNKNSYHDSIMFRTKKLYEHQDISIIASLGLLDNIISYISTTKYFEENKLHAIISNLAPFGNIIETNIDFVVNKLNYINQNLSNSTSSIINNSKSSIYKNYNYIYSYFNNNSNSYLYSYKNNDYSDLYKVKQANYENVINSNNKNDVKNTSDKKLLTIPAWINRININSKNKITITIKEELQYIKYPQIKKIGKVLCDLVCTADLSQICKVNLPLKDKGNTKCLKNMRIHPCSIVQHQFGNLSDITRIIFTPPLETFKLAVFEIEDINKRSNLPISGRFDLKELDEEIKLYLEISISKDVFGKFEYFNVTIPLGHFGRIVKTNTMVQVGEVTKINNDTSLLWSLQNDVIDSPIVLIGSIRYSKFKEDNEKRKKISQNKKLFNVSNEKYNEITNNLEIKNTPDVKDNSPIKNNHDLSKINSPTNTNIRIESIMSPNAEPNLIMKNKLSIVDNSNISEVSNKLHKQNDFDNMKILNKSKNNKLEKVYVSEYVNDKQYDLYEFIKKKKVSQQYNITTDIRDTNCYCNINFKLNNFSINELEIDKSGITFYPLLSPKIEIHKEFISKDFIIWNDHSFVDYNIHMPNKDEKYNLHDIIIED